MKKFALAFLLATTLSAHAQTDTRKSSTRTTAEEVIVQGSRRHEAGGGLIRKQSEAKSVSTISSAYIQTQSTLQNAYQYIQLAPGALVSESDPFGLSEQFSLNLRGLGQDEIGYVLEGMPLNDIGYYAAYPSQFIDSENIDEISLAQGSADLDSPVISAAGGLMNITMLDPSLSPGGSIDASYGSFNTDREFIRLDSGLIGAAGLRAFISYSHTDSDQWHGPGAVKRQHIDYKFVDEWGDNNRVTLTGTYHDGITPSYILPTQNQFQLNGKNNNYDAVFSPGDTNYYRLNIGTFRILYMSAPSRLTLTDHLTLNVTPYWQYGYGNSPYGADLTETGNYEGTDGPFTIDIPNDAATGGAVQANYTDLQYRAGLITKFSYTTGHNSIILGDWYDYSDETDTQSYTGLSASGVPPNIWVDTNAGLLRLPNGQIFLAGEDHVITQTNELFLADVLHLLKEKMTFEIGFKEAMVSRDGTNGLPGPQYHADINNAEPLPRFAARYQIDAKNQVFFSATTNFRTPSEATFFTDYYGSTPYTLANTNLKPEYSISEELGYRYTDALITASLTLFNYNFTDRQIATLASNLRIPQSINAGGQTSRGIDAELGTHPWHHVSPYISFEYLNATIDNDLAADSDYLPTKGKTAVRSPRVQAALGIAYDDGTIFGNLGVKYVDRQFSTFMNDESIPEYATVDVGIGYRLPKIGLKARPEVKLNVINIGDNTYLSGVANPTLNARDTVGRYGTLIAGSSPTYYLSGGLAVLFTAKQAF
jgi:iron complex outermembrane receptor protein